MRVYIVILFLPLLLACTAGKNAFETGNYYAAVTQSVNRLRQKPDHKKAQTILRESYKMAIEYLESDIDNQLKSNSESKWRTVVRNYEQINFLYEQIRTSPGALKVIPNPVSKYKELGEVKNKAAEEVYEQGIQAMLKNTRDDAKRAYYLFIEANNLSPGYRESIEMSNQAKFDATLKVVVEPSVYNPYSWTFEPILFNLNQQFVKFYTPAEAEEAKLSKIDQYVQVIMNGYNESKPMINKRVENFKDSVKVSEKTVNNVKVPVYQKVAASMTILEKVITARSSITLIIRDAASNADLKNSVIDGNARWNDRWATCTGDMRALSEANKKLCGSREPFMNRDFLINQTKRDLDSNLRNVLTGFYRNY